jgi:hypothetical protein
LALLGQVLLALEMVVMAEILYLEALQQQVVVAVVGLILQEMLEALVVVLHLALMLVLLVTHLQHPHHKVTMVVLGMVELIPIMVVVAVAVQQPLEQ